MKGKDIFWEASLEEIKKGYKENEEEYRCIICEEAFIKGRIYERDCSFYDAKKTMEIHIKELHGSVLEYLLQMNTDFTGISKVQQELLILMAAGLNDKEIAERLGVTSSTIRNHRYKLREKEKQARLFLAIMDMLSSNIKRKVNILEKDILCDAHKTATTLDDRYNITNKERETVINNYIDDNGVIKTFPSKEKKKIIILGEVVKKLSKGKEYSEKEINTIIERMYDDYATIRRALIEYGFIERAKDCSKYWIKE